MNQGSLNKSLLIFTDNWARELELWCPSLNVLHYHGPQEERRSIRCAIMNNDLEEEPDVILTTYVLLIIPTSICIYSQAKLVDVI